MNSSRLFSTYREFEYASISRKLVPKAEYQWCQARSGWEDTIKKWEDAHDLIQKGYQIVGMREVCGLCLMHKKRCYSCSLKNNNFCSSISDQYDPDCPNDVLDLRMRVTRLKAFHKELLEKETKCI